MNLDSTLAVTKTCPKDGVHLRNHKGLSRIRPALSHLVPHPKTFGRAHRACAPP